MCLTSVNILKTRVYSNSHRPVFSGIDKLYLFVYLKLFGDPLGVSPSLSVTLIKDSLLMMILCGAIVNFHII